MGRYIFKCIVPGCGYLFSADEDNVEKAVDRIMIDGETHNFDSHPEMPIMSEEKIKKMIEKGIKKIE